MWEKEAQPLALGPDPSGDVAEDCFFGWTGVQRAVGASSFWWSGGGGWLRQGETNLPQEQDTGEAEREVWGCWFCLVAAEPCRVTTPINIGKSSHLTEILLLKELIQGQILC